MTVTQVRRIFLEQPEAEEKSHMGHPDFRVGGKIFATPQPANRSDSDWFLGSVAYQGDAHICLGSK